MSTLEDVRLRTTRLTLRPVEPADADALLTIFSDPEVMRYWSSPPWTTRGQAEAMVADEQAGTAAGRSLRLGVVRVGVAPDSSDPLVGEDLIGTVSLFALDRGSRRAEIGYALASSAWGHGYAVEAVAAVVDHAFGELDLNRLEADLDPRNERSARLLERLGFRREGLLRDRWIVAGEVSDSAMYGLLRQDRPALR
jgi:RimJ/RimL family protein N-acetyltransferase